MKLYIERLRSIYMYTQNLWGKKLNGNHLYEQNVRISA